jgi:hypothetical protein
MNAQPLVNPALLGSLSAFYPLRADVEQLPTPDQLNADGEALRSAWTTVTGLTDIPARVTVYESRRGNEIRTNYSTYENRTYYILLAGWFPEIRMKMRLVVTEPKHGTQDVYDIRAVGFDSQNVTTKLFGEIIA